jgi:hypothetical protein
MVHTGLDAVAVGLERSAESPDAAEGSTSLKSVSLCQRKGSVGSECKQKNSNHCCDVNHTQPDSVADSEEHRLEQIYLHSDALMTSSSPGAN